MRKFYAASILCLMFFTSYHLQAQQKPDENLKSILRQNAAQLQLSRADVDDAFIIKSYTDAKTNFQYVYLQQAWQNIKVYNRILTIILRDNKILHVAGKFVSKMDSKAGTATPAVQADQAVIKAAQHLQLPFPVALQNIENKFVAEKKLIFSPAGIAKQNIVAELLWVVADDDSTVRLAWNVNIDVLHSADWWNVRVDAVTGEVIEKDNMTIYEAANKESNEIYTSDHKTSLLIGEKVEQAVKQTAGIQKKQFIPYLPPPTVTNAAYYVVPFPYESPTHHALGIENEPWLRAGAANPAITNGWHFDGTTNYDITRGNNVFAYLDVTNSNAPNATTNWPDTSTTPIPSLTFNFPPNFNLQPGTVTNKRTAVANLFYWNNLMHDVYYQYGFNEAAGNFQTDNLGRGGIGNDYVQAEAQDGGGTNNANFATPPDGSRPRMQMYLWTTGPALFNVLTPPAIAGSYTAVEGAFSTNNLLANVGPVTGQVIYYNDNTGGLHEACVPPSNSLTGKIALIDRGNCTFIIKVKNAQDAGAIAVIMVNNVAGAPIIMGGADNTIIIPAVMISQSDGAIIAAQLGSGVTVTIGAPINIDGDLDNGIICHEYGHGISNRCTGGGGGSCLNNAERGSEGWSDYIALMMVTNWATATISDGVLPRSIGTYAFGQPVTGGGIRNLPYSTNIAINPLVYAATLPAQVHNLGEVWCMALWEMTWEMIQLDGINPNIYNAAAVGGNSAAMKVMVEGMKLQPCSPGFIDARNAILRADTLFFAAHYSCAIWKAFAKRGMGRNALQGSSNSVTDQTPDFSVGYAAISVQPSNTSVCTGANANFSVTATGVSLSYQWQLSTNGGSTFNNISGATTSTLTLTAVTLAMNNNQYRCIVIGSCGPSVTSTAGILTVSLGPTLTVQPLSQTVCAGNNAIFSVTVTGPVTGYQWQVSTNGGSSFTDIPGATTSTLTLTAVTLAMNNNQYRSVISASCGAGLTSTAAILTVNLSAAITTQPSNSAVCVGANASFSVTATGATGYQWQVSTNGGGSFADIPGATTSTLTLTAVTLAMNNNQYRCIVVGSCGPSVTSTAGILTVAAGPALTVQPLPQTVCAGSNAIFSVTVTGPVTGYQWQVSTNGGSSFTDIPGATTSTLTLTAVTLAMNNNQYRCVISASCGAGLTSTAAILTVNVSAAITTQPSGSAVCIGANASFSVSATGATGYQWQVSTNGGTTFTDIPGATTSTLTLTAVTAGMNNNQYRCVISSVCTGATSNAAILTVFAPPTVTSQPVNATVCETSNANFSVTASGPITGYQWQVSTDGGATYNNVSGATTASLALNAVAFTQNGNRYRVVITGNCVVVNSNAALLTVNASPVFTLVNIPSTLCVSDTAITLTASLAGGVWTGTGVQGNKFVPSVAGVGVATITYTVTNASGCVRSLSANIQVNECPERHILLSGPGSLVIYPNPNNGLFNIRIKTDLYTRLGMRVYSSTGQLLNTQLFAGLFYNRIVPVDLNRLPNGLYNLFLYNDENGKFIKKTYGIVINR